MPNDELNSLYDSAFSILVDDAAYLTPPNGPHSIDPKTGQRYHFPSPEFFESLVWNIVIAFWVNILASHIYNKYFASNKKVYSKDELKDIQNEAQQEHLTGTRTAQKTKSQRTKISIGSIFQMEQESGFIEWTTETLERHGWPSDEARSRSEEISTSLSTASTTRGKNSKVSAEESDQ